MVFNLTGPSFGHFSCFLFWFSMFLQCIKILKSYFHKLKWVYNRLEPNWSGVLSFPGFLFWFPMFLKCIKIPKSNIHKSKQIHIILFNVTGTIFSRFPCFLFWLSTLLWKWKYYFDLHCNPYYFIFINKNRLQNIHIPNIL